MSFKDEPRTSADEPRQDRTERELRGEDDLPIWGQENSREEFIEGHYGTTTPPGRAASTGPRPFTQSNAPSSRVGEELTPTTPTAGQSSRREMAEHDRMFAEPEPLTPSSADAASNAGQRRTKVVTFRDVANARDRITIGSDDE